VYKNILGGINISSRHSRRERKKKQMRLRILEAAENLYRNKTLSEVSMEDISERADISRVTLYNYFTNQDCIILNIGIKNLQKIRERQKEKKISLLSFSGFIEWFSRESSES
jgi:AcrR family transcriptional regulator